MRTAIRNIMQKREKVLDSMIGKTKHKLFEIITEARKLHLTVVLNDKKMFTILVKNINLLTLEVERQSVTSFVENFFG